MVSRSMDLNSPKIEDALILIDGVESTFEAMTKLNPNNIKSLTVLKDVSSKEYGEKGRKRGGEDRY